MPIIRKKGRFRGLRKLRRFPIRSRLSKKPITNRIVNKAIKTSTGVAEKSRILNLGLGLFEHKK